MTQPTGTGMITTAQELFDYLGEKLNDQFYSQAAHQKWVNIHIAEEDAKELRNSLEALLAHGDAKPPLPDKEVAERMVMAALDAYRTGMQNRHEGASVAEQPVNQVSEPAPISDVVSDMLRKGHVVEAIRAYKSATNCPLKDAVAYVKEIKASLDVNHSDDFEPEPAAVKPPETSAPILPASKPSPNADPMPGDTWIDKDPRRNGRKILIDANDGESVRYTVITSGAKNVSSIKRFRGKAKKNGFRLYDRPTSA